MTLEEKQRIDNYPIMAHRGNIHKFIEVNGEYRNKYCLVVSSELRAEDRLVNILFLSEHRSRISSVAVTMPDGSELYANAGLVTYCPRTCLGEYMTMASVESMKKLDRKLREELGIE